MHLTALKALKLSPLHTSELQNTLAAYTQYVKELKELLELCESLKQNFKGDSRFRFENFPLAWSFHQTERIFSKSAFLWMMILLIDILGLFSMAYWNFFKFPQLITSINANLNVTDSAFISLISDPLIRSFASLVLLMLFIWLAWFATKHCNVATRLKYEYAYRTSIAATYTNYREESESADPEVTKEALKHLFAPITSSWNNKEPSSPYESFFTFFKGRTARKIIKAVFKDGLESLTEFVNSLTDLISRTEDKNDKKKKSKSKGKANSPSATDRFPFLQENADAGKNLKSASVKKVKTKSKDNRSECSSLQEQNSGNESSDKHEASENAPRDSTDA